MKNLAASIAIFLITPYIDVIYLYSFSVISLDRQEIEEQQALGVIQADPPVALIEHLGQQVQSGEIGRAHV